MPLLNPEDFPEEMREQIASANEQFEQASQQAARYEGIADDPELIRQGVTMLKQYNDPVRGQEYREMMARQWGVLGEGQTLDDLRTLQQQVANYPGEQHDPFAENGVYDDPDAAAAIGMFDQRYVGKQEIDAIRSEMKALVEQERRQATMEADALALASQERDLIRRLQADGITVSDKAMEATRAILKDRLMEERVNGSNFHTAVEDAWTEFQDIVQSEAQAIMQKQQSAPKVSNPASASPGESTPVTDIKSAVKLAQERLAAMRASGEFDNIE